MLKDQKRRMMDPRLMRGMALANPDAELTPEQMAEEMARQKLPFVLLYVLTVNNPYDRMIVDNLLSGAPLDAGQKQHLLDEVGKVNRLPEHLYPSVELLQKPD